MPLQSRGPGTLPAPATTEYRYPDRSGVVAPPRSMETKPGPPPGGAAPSTRYDAAYAPRPQATAYAFCALDVTRIFETALASFAAALARSNPADASAVRIARI